ncbi:MAG: dCTP deaminase [Candidatus Aenigmatarchaeota archaeon]
MILSDRDIRKYLNSKRLIIDGLEDERIHAGWVELSLGNEFKIFKISSQSHIDIRNHVDNTESVMIDEQPFILHPREFVLGHIKERITLPDDLAAYVDGRSSLGRIGIVVHVTSGFVDPGFSGKLVLEMTNVGKMPVALYKDMKICKLVFFKLSSPAEKPYNIRNDAKYRNQSGVSDSMLHKDFESSK